MLALSKKNLVVLLEGANCLPIVCCGDWGMCHLLLSNRFLSLDEQPIAAASIAQVHRAVLKDQQEVAVKVCQLSIAGQFLLF